MFGNWFLRGFLEVLNDIGEIVVKYKMVVLVFFFVKKIRGGSVLGDVVGWGYVRVRIFKMFMFFINYLGWRNFSWVFFFVDMKLIILYKVFVLISSGCELLCVKFIENDMIFVWL